MFLYLFITNSVPNILFNLLNKNKLTFIFVAYSTYFKVDGQT